MLSRSSGNDVAIHNIGGTLAFRTGGESTTLGGLTERMRIDASGNLLVGTTENNVTNNSGNNPGINIGVAGIKGFMSSARYQGPPLSINRLGNDGDIQLFSKDGATVGSIGVASEYLYIHGTRSTDAGLMLGSQVVAPASSTGANRNDAIDLGFNGNSFKDLYLSGGVYLGGTGSANKLDDYETGTWTPALNNAPSGISIVGTTAHNNYTKIGNLVFLTGYIELNTGSSSGNSILIEGLPFNPTSTNAAAGSFIIKYGSSDTYAPFMGSNSRVEFYKINNTGNWNLMTYSNVGNPFSAHFTISYQT